MIDTIQNAVHSFGADRLLIIGLIVIVAFYFGRSMKILRLPSIIGFMIIGVILGPSFLGILDEGFQHSLSFIPDIALGFVALSIGIELSFSTLKKQGAGIITVILTESFLAFGFVAILMYLLTKDLALSLLFGAIAPASAPAGTVAIIHEYKAKGPLTKALYSVVGFDDGLGIIIFGFAAAFAKSILQKEMGEDTGSIVELLGVLLMEVGFSTLAGFLLSMVFSFLASRLKNARDIFILIFGTVLFATGLSNMMHLSLILTNMIIGITVVNTQKHHLVEKIHNELSNFMPLLFVLFFVLAGANLHVAAIPALGIIGVVYIAGRSIGLVTGATIGATMGRLSKNIRKYLGMGILSQAGVAIGLSLIVKNEFSDFGSHGLVIGSTILTTVTATSIFFEIIGPILTKIGLEKAGEIRLQEEN